MPLCVICECRYQKNVFNNSEYCHSCLESDVYYDEDDALEVKNIQNPSGKTQAVFYDSEDNS